MQRLVVALTALLVLIGVAVVALFVFVLGATSDRAAALAPASTIAYANVYLQPSTAQQSRLGALIGRLPGFADTAALDEKIDQVAQNLLSGVGIDYRRQLEPWLGDQLAIAAWPDAAGEMRMAVMIAVTDPAGADAALTDFATSSGGSTPESGEHAGVTIVTGEQMSWAMVDEMVVAAPSAAAVRDVIEVAGGEPSLANDDDFARTMGELGADHLASAYVDVPQLVQLAGTDAAALGIGPAAAVLVAEEDGLRLSGSAPVDGAVAQGEASDLAAWMPEGTQAQVTISGIGGLLGIAERIAGETPEGEDLTDALATLRALGPLVLGVDLDDDILPLLDGPIAVAASDLAAATPRLTVVLQPPDAERAASTLRQLGEGLELVGGSVTTGVVAGRAEVTLVAVPDFPEVAYAVVDEVLVAGLDVDDVAAAIEAHDAGATLAEAAAYRRTLALAGGGGPHMIYVDVSALVDATGAADELSADARDILHEIGTFGLVATFGEERLDFRAVMTVD